VIKSQFFLPSIEGRNSLPLHHPEEADGVGGIKVDTECLDDGLAAHDRAGVDVYDAVFELDGVRIPLLHVAEEAQGNRLVGIEISVEQVLEAAKDEKVGVAIADAHVHGEVFGDGLVAGKAVFGVRVVDHVLGGLKEDASERIGHGVQRSAARDLDRVRVALSVKDRDSVHFELVIKIRSGLQISFFIVFFCTKYMFDEL
jgi:hypothetical protein